MFPPIMPTSPATTPVIRLAGLDVRLGGRPVLRALEVALTGRAIGLLGPNGAGKTTLIQTLLGFRTPSSGTAYVFGEDVRHQGKALRSRIGYMPEGDSFVAEVSAVRLVRMLAELSGLPSEAALERTHEALNFVGLGEARYRPVGTYSLGMKQLVKLAQAIVHGPQLLFLDEPTNGLDPPARRRMLQLIRDIRDSGQTQLLVSSHLLRDVEECCEEVLVLKDGAIAAHADLAAERRQNRQFLELELARPADGHARADGQGDGDGDVHSGGAAAFIAAVEGQGGTSALHANGRLKLVLPEGLGVRDLYALAARHDVAIHRLSYRRDSLHDLFMKAMEG